MGCCVSKDDIEEDRIYFKTENYTEEDVRELGTCEMCSKKGELVSYYEEGSMCEKCEVIMMGRGGFEEVYIKKKKALYEIDLN